MVVIIGSILIFVAGAFVGSFLNVISDRIPKGLSPFRGRSKCDHCKKPLRANDLVPLLSYVRLRAQCRYCGEKLSFYYPLSEALTGLTFVGIAYLLNVFSTQNPLIWLSFTYISVIASFLLVILLTDIKYKLIPNKIVFPAIAFILVFMIGTILFVGFSSYMQMNADPFGQYLLEVGYWHDQMWLLLRSLLVTVGSALVIAGFFWFLIWVTKGRGMGGGDVKLAFLIGLINGFPLNIVAIVLAFVTGALFSGGLMLLKRKGMKDVIPFGPFLVLGSAIAFVFGQAIFDWYIALI